MQNTALASDFQQPNEHANALASGTALMEYRLDHVLGSGGFGITYLAWDPNLEKQVAIKEYMPAQLAVRALDGSVVPIATEQKYDYAWGLDRFVQEARTLARFSHPHIVRVIRYIEANGTAYMVMEYEAGLSLAQWLCTHPRPAESALRSLVRPLLEGLEAVHAQGFLHRDIKPGNVFMRANDEPVLLDFGAARQAVGSKSVSLTSIVSPGYAPLEQYASDGNQGPWTDVYSLSAVLYRAITGQNPPEAVSRLKIDRVGIRLAAAKSRYSETFLKAVELGMAIDEKLRPQSVAEWRQVLVGDAAEVAQPAPLGVVARGAQAKTTIVSGASTPQHALAHATRVTPARSGTTQAAAGVRRWPWIVVGMLLTGVIAIFMRAAPERTAAARAEISEPAVMATMPAVPVQAPQAAPTSEPGAGVQSHPFALRSAPRPAPASASVEAARIATAVDAQRPASGPRPKPPPQYLNAPPKPNPTLLRDFQAADRDGDGALSRAEAQARMPRLAQDFMRVDANRGGRVTLIELQHYLQSGSTRGAVQR